jgi:hypothetical protein
MAATIIARRITAGGVGLPQATGGRVRSRFPGDFPDNFPNQTIYILP